ncbi:MAG: hypothetical protein QM522_10995, partial [Chitinophagaceae bacterium]|nr:hypothetical protein [Chitinophagaceae bacterium]
SVKDAYNARKAKATGGAYLNPSSISEGEKVRITFLGEDSLAGFEAWVSSRDGSKRIPLRFGQDPTRSDLEERAADEGGVVDAETVAKPFYAFAVFNYDAEAVQVFQFSQQSLAGPIIDALSDEEVEAEPHLYDFVMSATGTGRDKRYSVLPVPGRRRKADADKTVAAAWEAVLEKGFDLDVLLSGGDPFKGIGF